MKILVTGGAGFIGSHFIKYVLQQKEVKKIINLDKLTYAGNLSTLREVEKNTSYEFVKGDIADPQVVESIFQKGVDAVVNFAAETHVDRSIQNPGDLIQTDVYGVYVLLEACKKFGIQRFIQVSTDEVYGSIAEGFAHENYPLMPSNPYSASKAGGDRLAYSYFKTYALPVIVTRTSNNYGPFQYPEKLIPLFITNAIEGKKLPLYGDGLYRRDWIHAVDHCSGLWFLLKNGQSGETYNIAGQNETNNLQITEMILNFFGLDHSSVEKVKDRPGHDRRYAIDDSKIQKLGWKSTISFEKGLRETIEWFQSNAWWWEPIKKGDFRKYYQKQYGES